MTLLGFLRRIRICYTWIPFNFCLLHVPLSSDFCFQSTHAIKEAIIGALYKSGRAESRKLTFATKFKICAFYAYWNLGGLWFCPCGGWCGFSIRQWLNCWNHRLRHQVSDLKAYAKTIATALRLPTTLPFARMLLRLILLTPCLETAATDMDSYMTETLQPYPGPLLHLPRLVQLLILLLSCELIRPTFLLVGIMVVLIPILRVRTLPLISTASVLMGFQLPHFARLGGQHAFGFGELLSPNSLT